MCFQLGWANFSLYSRRLEDTQTQYVDFSAERALKKNQLIMRGQLGPHVVPGNAPAARRHARKPPPIILWSIGIITCIFFMGSAALLTVGYLNPFGTVGLSILGVGAVVYFVTIIFLVMSCLWVERKYPGMQPLSFRIYSRKPQRLPPTAFTNPNISGQTPSATVPSYRIHSEQPTNITGSTDIKGKMDNVPKDTTKDKNKQSERNMPGQRSSTAQESLQDEGSDAVASRHKVPEATSQPETSTGSDDTSPRPSRNGGLKENSLANAEYLKAKTDNTADTSIQTKNTSQHSQKDNNMATAASPQKENKVQPKTFPLDLPLEDYNTPFCSSTATSNTQESSLDKPKDVSPHRCKSLENNVSHISVGPAISTSPEEKSTTHQQKDTNRNYVTCHSGTTDKQIAENESPSVHQIHQNTYPSNTEEGKSSEKEQRAQDNSQRSNLQRSPQGPQIQAPQRKNILKVSHEKVTDLASTESDSLDFGGKPTLHKKQDTAEQLPKPGNNMDSALLTKSSIVSKEKIPHTQKYPVQSSHLSMNPPKDSSRISSNTEVSKLLHCKNDGMHEHQNKAFSNSNISASSKHSTKNPDLQGALPGLGKKLESPKKLESQERQARKQDSPERKNKSELPERPKTVESPERGRKLRHDHKLSHSPNNIKESDPSSSPSKHHQRTPDNSPKVQRKKDHSVSNLPSSNEDLHRKRNYHSSPSSQSSDVSSSPPMRHKRSPDVSPKVPKHQVHGSGNTAFHSNARKEEHNSHSQHSSPSSYSSDISSSPPSSPQRHRQRSPDMSKKAQRHKDILSNTGLSSSSTKDALNKKPNHQSSQSSDDNLTPTTSPLIARKVIQNKPDQTQINKSTGPQHTKNQPIETSGARGEYRHQVKHQHPDKPRSTSQSREMSPTAATTSPPTNKRFSPNLSERIKLSNK